MDSQEKRQVIISLGMYKEFPIIQSTSPIRNIKGDPIKNVEWWWIKFSTGIIYSYTGIGHNLGIDTNNVKEKIKFI